jgi:hypothetical protein
VRTAGLSCCPDPSSSSAAAAVTRRRRQAGLADLTVQYQRRAAVLHPVQQRRELLRLGIATEERSSLAVRRAEHETEIVPGLGPHPARARSRVRR